MISLTSTFFTAAVVSRDWATSGRDPGDHPRGEPGSAIQGHPDGRPTGEGSLCAHRGRVRERREVGGIYLNGASCKTLRFFSKACFLQSEMLKFEMAFTKA